MPLVFCSATSADRPRRSVSAVFLARRSVPQFVQVFGFGKNERHWVGNLRRGGNPPVDFFKRSTSAGKQPARRIPSGHTKSHYFALPRQNSGSTSAKSLDTRRTRGSTRNSKCSRLS